jgi:hypothetical protein
MNNSVRSVQWLTLRVCGSGAVGASAVPRHADTEVNAATMVAAYTSEFR